MANHEHTLAESTCRYRTPTLEAMTEAHKFDLVVIGGGTAGLVAAAGRSEFWSEGSRDRKPLFER